MFKVNKILSKKFHAAADSDPRNVYARNTHIHSLKLEEAGRLENYYTKGIKVAFSMVVEKAKDSS